MLTCNVYFALLVFSLLLAEQYVHVFIGHRYSFLRYNDGVDCPTRAYLQLVSICTIFYSNTLQAIYRLCRVVFYTRPALRSVRLYRIVIVGQWIFCFLIVVPTLLMNDFEYLPDDYHCQIGFTNYRSTLLNGIVAYLVPMNITGGCYVYTLRKIRRGHTHLLENMSQIQQISARRDLIVLFRICLLLSLLMSFFIPSLVLLVIYQRTGYLAWWASQVQWLVFITSVTCVTVALAVISPHVYNLWFRLVNELWTQ